MTGQAPRGEPGSGKEPHRRPQAPGGYVTDEEEAGHSRFERTRQNGRTTSSGDTAAQVLTQVVETVEVQPKTCAGDHMVVVHFRSSASVQDQAHPRA